MGIQGGTNLLLVSQWQHISAPQKCQHLTLMRKCMFWKLSRLHNNAYTYYPNLFPHIIPEFKRSAYNPIFVNIAWEFINNQSEGVLPI